MAKGDWIRIVHDEGVVELQATANGRKVSLSSEKEGGVVWIVATEATRGGTVTGLAKVPVDRVVAIHTHIKEED